MNDVRGRILEVVDSLSPAEKQVASAILTSYPSLATRSAAEIAETAKVSTASVTRFVARLEFQSFKEFRDAILLELSTPVAAEAPLGGPHLSKIERVAEVDARNVNNTLNRLTATALAETRDALLSASEVAILGGRFSYSLAMYLHTHLQIIRPDVYLVSRANVADQIAHYGRGTCMVIFDYPRYQPDAETAVRYIKRRRGRAIVFTDPYLSPASQRADITLIADIEGPSPVIDSFVAPTALIDMIVTDLVTAGHGQTEQRIRVVHEARDMFWKYPELEDPRSDG